MARYADTLLTDGEHVVYRTRQHPFGRLALARYGILAVGLGLALLLIIFIFNVTTGRDILGWVVLILVLAGAVNITWVYLRWYQEDYLVTNRRVVKVEGLLNKKSADSGLEKINDAILEQSVFGRMFDWGNLRILTAAEEIADDYHMLHHAPQFKKVMLLAKQDIEEGLMRRVAAPIEALQQHEADEEQRHAAELSAARATAAPAAPAPVAPSLEQKLTELARLRDQGLISPEDYEAKKTALLANL